VTNAPKADAPPSIVGQDANAAIDRLAAKTTLSASNHGASSAAAKADAEGLTEPQHRALAARLSKGLGAALRQGNGAVTLRLVPEALGQLRIALNFDAGRVSVDLQAQNNAALRAVTDHLSSLRTSLEARGMQVDRLTTSLLTSARPASESSTSNHNSSQQHQQTGSDGSSRHDAGDGRSRGFFSEDRSGRDAARRDNRDQASAGDDELAPGSRFDSLLTGAAG